MLEWIGYWLIFDSYGFLCGWCKFSRIYSITGSITDSITQNIFLYKILYTRSPHSKKSALWVWWVHTLDSKCQILNTGKYFLYNFSCTEPPHSKLSRLHWSWVPTFGYKCQTSISELELNISGLFIMVKFSIYNSYCIGMFRNTSPPHRLWNI